VSVLICFLPLSYLFDFKRTNFYLMLNESHVNSVLFHWFGDKEVSDITYSVYNIAPCDNQISHGSNRT